MSTRDDKNRDGHNRAGDDDDDVFERHDSQVKFWQSVRRARSRETGEEPDLTIDPRKQAKVTREVPAIRPEELRTGAPTPTPNKQSPSDDDPVPDDFADEYEERRSWSEPDDWSRDDVTPVGDEDEIQRLVEESLVGVELDKLVDDDEWTDEPTDVKEQPAEMAGDKPGAAVLKTKPKRPGSGIFKRVRRREEPDAD